MIHQFSLLIKPTSADCNLRCDYCFYLNKNSLYPTTKLHRMPDDVLEQLISKYMSTPQTMHSFGWQGGEPTLMGIDFFYRVLELQKKYGRPNSIVGNGLQTNATLLDNRMAKLLHENNFLVGCSLDGPPDIHNQFRRTRNNEMTHDLVIQGINSLKRNHVEFNILILVTQANVTKAKEVYNYLVNNGFYFHQYIPCVEFDGEGQLEPYAISAEEWGRFLCDIYDEWYPKDIYKVSIRHLDSILNKMVTGISDICTLNDNCCQYFVVEHNGDIYPCDFFVKKSLKIGNIMNSSWDELLESSIYTHFGKQKNLWSQQCNECDYLYLCQGDCPKHRSTYGLSHLCDGWKVFYQHTRNGFNLLAGKIQQQRLHPQFSSTFRSSPSEYQPPRVGRNKPCPCGSGLKYKKCCSK